ncbi:MAG: BREX-1 system adenine-specific DNA-methyltransferase PglX, partial [Thermoguttaceae bacterium]|nr:BREX-1 system adenine-specific DNA-methyltransferase PglX [Thermoguttaceae bacterium]
GNNDLFLKLWWELIFQKIKTDCQSYADCIKAEEKWFPYNKGGESRNWYGNRNLVIDLEDGGANIRAYSKNFGTSIDLSATDVYFKQGITWTALTSAKNTFRFSPVGSAFDSNKGPMVFNENIELLYYLLGYFISVVAQFYLKVFNPSLSLQNGDMDNLPIIVDEKRKIAIEGLVTECVALSKADWDAFETSWDFARHPLLGRSVATVAEAFAAWEAECDERFRRLKANEEELNRIFIDIYGLADELTPEVDDKDVTVRKADLVRDVKSLISYAVGCMFGRYSLEVDGLAYAGGDWDASKYGDQDKNFQPDEDAIIPICDDYYFKDDATTRFAECFKFAFGAETLDDNLRLIAVALGGDGKAPKETIRAYFLNGFFKDHVQTYQKRPIYWLFDSGKKNGFKALLYVHRYRPDTIARLRVKYVHELQGRYRAQLERLDAALDAADLKSSERVNLTKRRKKLDDQAHELRKYEEKVRVRADEKRVLDLDDGVKHNYALFADILASIK